MSRQTRWLGRLVLIAVWLAAVLAGFGAFEAYKATPGDVGPTPSHALLLREMAAAGGRPVLLLFVHPQCPCSQASLAELAEILARCPAQVTAEVVFVRPEGLPEDWEQGPLRSTAASIPGVRIRSDPGGSLARQLGVKTSGHVVLADATGVLLFSGGITRARGHAADNTGRRAVLALLEGQSAGPREVPVFGCPLFAPCSPPAAQGDDPCPK